MFISLRACLNPKLPPTRVSPLPSTSASLPQVNETVEKTIEEFQRAIDDLGDFEIKIICGVLDSKSSLTSYGDFLAAYVQGQAFTDEAVHYALSLADEFEAIFPGRRLNSHVAAQASRVAMLHEHRISVLCCARDKAVVDLMASLIGLVSALMDLSNKLDGTCEGIDELPHLWLQRINKLLPERTAEDIFSSRFEEFRKPPRRGCAGTSKN